MATVHASSARGALEKMSVLPLLAGENVTDRFVLPTVASAIDLVVHVAVGADGRRGVREILGVPGRVEGGVIETETLFTTRDGALRRGEGEPPRPELFAASGTAVRDLLAA